MLPDDFRYRVVQVIMVKIDVYNSIKFSYFWIEKKKCYPLHQLCYHNAMIYKKQKNYYRRYYGMRKVQAQNHLLLLSTVTETQASGFRPPLL